MGESKNPTLHTELCTQTAKKPVRDEQSIQSSLELTLVPLGDSRWRMTIEMVGFLDEQRMNNSVVGMRRNTETHIFRFRSW